MNCPKKIFHFVFGDYMILATNHKTIVLNFPFTDDKKIIDISCYFIVHTYKLTILKIGGFNNYLLLSKLFEKNVYIILV